MGYVYRFGEEHPKMVDSEKIQKVKIYAEIVAILKSIGLTDEAIEYALKTPATTLRRWSEKQGSSVENVRCIAPSNSRRYAGRKRGWLSAMTNDQQVVGDFSPPPLHHIQTDIRGPRMPPIYSVPPVFWGFRGVVCISLPKEDG